MGSTLKLGYGWMAQNSSGAGLSGAARWGVSGWRCSILTPLLRPTHKIRERSLSAGRSCFEETPKMVGLKGRRKGTLSFPFGAPVRFLKPETLVNAENP